LAQRSELVGNCPHCPPWLRACLWAFHKL